MIRKKNIVIIMMVICMINFSFFSCTAKENTKVKGKINITDPLNDAKVGLQYLVRGKVSTDYSGNVYVLVHPILTDLCWVQQPPLSINGDGTWQSLCYFGTENQGIGESFEIIAIITTLTLKAGQTFKITGLPQDAIKSSLITVKRTK